MNKPMVQIQTQDNRYDIAVEIADNDEERARGLMGREELSENEGMLFIYNDDTEAGFWMKNMKIPIDMVFIDSEGKIVHIQESAPPCRPDEKCSVYKSGSLTRYVLELPSGFCRKNRVRTGDHVIFKM